MSKNNPPENPPEDPTVKDEQSIIGGAPTPAPVREPFTTPAWKGWDPKVRAATARWNNESALVRLSVGGALTEHEFGGKVFTNTPTVYATRDLGWDEATWAACHEDAYCVVEFLDSDGRELPKKRR